MEDIAAHGTETQEPVSETVASPFCGELRSKKYYFLQAMPTEASQIIDASGHCWCRRTMQVVGPDSEKVGPRHCGPDRTCYKSLFEA